MKRFMILLFMVLCLSACEKYRVVEMEDESFNIQVRFLGIYTNPIIITNADSDYFVNCRNLTKEEACFTKNRLKELDEKERKAKTVKKVINCYEKEEE